MTNHLFEKGIIGNDADKPDAGNVTGKAENVSAPVYFAADTGKIYVSTGHAWVQIGSFLPGVTSDGANGLNIQHALNQGDRTRTDDYDQAAFYGGVYIQDVAGTAVTGGNLLAIEQSEPVDPAHLPQSTVLMERNGDTSLGQYQGPMILINDFSGAPHSVIEIQTGNGSGGIQNCLHIGIGGSLATVAYGGLGAYGVTPPTTRPTTTLATSTITDANAKATIKALIGIINGCGLAAITES